MVVPYAKLCGPHRNRKIEASDTLYVKALAGTFTSTPCRSTLKGSFLPIHGPNQLGPQFMGADGGTCEQMLQRFNEAEGYPFEETG